MSRTTSQPATGKFHSALCLTEYLDVDVGSINHSKALRGCTVTAPCPPGSRKTWVAASFGGERVIFTGSLSVRIRQPRSRRSACRVRHSKSSPDNSSKGRRSPGIGRFFDRTSRTNLSHQTVRSLVRKLIRLHVCIDCEWLARNAQQRKWRLTCLMCKTSDRGRIDKRCKSTSSSKVTSVKHILAVLRWSKVAVGFGLRFMGFQRIYIFLVNTESSPCPSHYRQLQGAPLCHFSNAWRTSLRRRQAIVRPRKKDEVISRQRVTEKDRSGPCKRQPPSGVTHAVLKLDGDEAACV